METESTELLYSLRTASVPKHRCNTMKIPCEKCILSTLNENTEFPWNGMWWGAHGREYSVFLPKGRSFEKNRPFARQQDGKVMSLYKYAEMEELNNWLAWTLHLSLLINVTSYNWNGVRVLECLWIRLNYRMNFFGRKKKKRFCQNLLHICYKGVSVSNWEGNNNNKLEE